MKFLYSADEEEIYSRLNYMRGGLAFIVLLSHIWGYTDMIFLVPFNKIVTIAVAFFFFLSGYGMTRSYIRKQNYLHEIVLIKIPFLCWMAVLAYFFSAISEKALILWGGVKL